MPILSVSPYGIGKDEMVLPTSRIEIRKGTASFDRGADALARFTAAVVANRVARYQPGFSRPSLVRHMEANLIDVAIVIGDKIISNYIHNLTHLEIDFPLAEEP